MCSSQYRERDFDLANVIQRLLRTNTQLPNFLLSSFLEYKKISKSQMIYTVKQLKEGIQDFSKKNKEVFDEYQREILMQLGTIPNRKMKKKDLIMHFGELISRLEKSKNIKKIEAITFECPVCYVEKEQGLSRCFDQRHLICVSCSDLQDQYEVFACPLCRVDRFEQMRMFCCIGDRKNINAQHIKNILKFREIKVGLFKEKWLNFHISNIIGVYQVFITTDRFIMSKEPHIGFDEILV